MTDIKGQKYLTINAEADETYHISFEGSYTVNIVNQTDSTITIAAAPDYADDGTVAGCIRLSEQNFINGFHPLGCELYITSHGEGSIAVVRAA